MNRLRLLCGALVMGLAWPVADAAASTPAPLGSRTSIYFQFGQSNAVGIAPLIQLPASADYSGVPMPVQEVQLFSGSGETARYRVRNLRYIRTRAETVTDSIDGPITGPRGETNLDLNTKVTVTAMSSFIGVAEAAAAGQVPDTSRVIFLKVARGATLIDGHDPYAVPFGGIVYKNGRRAFIRWLRAYVDAEAKAQRFVDLKMAEVDQGEREAALAKSSGQLPSPQMIVWADTMRTRIYPYYAEKFGVPYRLLIRQLIPIRVANGATAALDPYTVAQNVIEESVCRYTVTINNDGTIASVVDNGASPTRLDHAYFLKHGMNPASYIDVHADYRLNRAFGLAKVNLEQYLRTSNPNDYMPPLTRIAPVIMSYTNGTPTITTVTINMFVDEIANVYLLAVPAGSPAPSIAAVQSAGRQFSSKVTVNGDGFTQAFRLTGLQALRAYDIYACASDPIYGHTGPVKKVATNITTTS